MNFRIGQKVVCVNAYHKLLTRGRVYTVRDTYACCTMWLDVGLREAPSSNNTCGLCGDTGGPDSTVPLFDASAFRPVDDLTLTLALEASRTVIEERPEHISVPQYA